jgi:hypothetical protein
MSAAKPCPTPTALSSTLSLHASFDDPYLYRSVVGKLQYVTIIHPDIAFDVNKVS